MTDGIVEVRTVQLVGVDRSASGELAVERRAVEVHDHGTGLGAVVAAAVGIDGPDAADLVRGEAVLAASSTVVERGPLVVHLRQVDGHLVVGSDPSERIVSVELRRPESADPVGPWHTPAHSAAERAQSMVTRARLDDHDAWPHLHGGALREPSDGAAVLVVGLSGAGKSTLVANLAAAGLHLLNDEQLSLHPAEGLVAGFTRPVAIKAGGGDHLPVGVAVPDGQGTAFLRAGDLGTRPGLLGKPRLVVFPVRSDDHETVPAWEQVRAIDAVEELVANSLDVARDPEGALSAIAWLATAAPVVRVRYRDAAAAVPLIRELLDGDLPADGAAWSLRVAGPGGGLGATDEALAVDVPPAGGAVGATATEGVLELAVGGSCLLLEPRSRNLAVLTGPAADVWSTLPWEALDVDDDVRWAVDLLARLAERGIARMWSVAGSN